MALKVNQMTSEIERRKFLEKKVQVYVKSLILQNQKAKEYLENWANSSEEPQKSKIANFLTELE